MSGELEQIESIFHRARELPLEDRAAYLDEQCGESLDLRAEVESLLAHGEQHTRGLDLRPDTGSAGSTTIVDRGRLSEGPGTRIGPYKILQEIGEGGFGVVYMAEQMHPVRRKVAIKIIKLGMDTKQVIARFEAERQALALMDHPNIARVLDAGATETGRPYFVMELVRGIPISEYCDKQNLSTVERLELFIKVCRAVQHAHQKGIIHRDLKPSNVMVTLHDTEAVPKVIDFGIAKATSHRLTEKTLFTEFRQFIGTPEYMSPDQAEISGLDIDTRTDIYSLGVLLYELLTGTTPLDPERLRAAGYGEIQRIITEEHPPLPSTRVSSMGEQLTGIAHHRQVEPGALCRLMRGDLDWIVMKAMEKDRTRRYATATELAAAVERHLNREPVFAGPPSVIYKLRKFIARHRVVVTASALVAAALMVFIPALIYQYFNLRSSRQETQSAMLQFKQEAARSKEVSDFLQSLITDLEMSADDVTGESVANIVARGRELFGDDHAVIGGLLTARASSLRTAGQVDDAIHVQREAVLLYRGAGSEGNIAEALQTLGELYQDQREYGPAESTLREAMEMKQRLFGDESMVTAEATLGLTMLLKETGVQDRNDEIKQLWARAITTYEASLGSDHRDTVHESCRFASWLYQEDDPDALDRLVVAVERGKRVLADSDMTLFTTIDALCQLRILQEQDYDDAANLLIDLIRMSDAMWGPTHRTTVGLYLPSTVVLTMAQRHDEADHQIDQYLALRRSNEILPTHLLTLQGQVAFNVAQDAMEARPEVGREFLLHIVDDLRQLSTADSESFLEVLESAGEWLFEHDFQADTIPLLQEGISLLRTLKPDDHASLAAALVHLGGALTDEGRPAECEQLLREALELRQDILDPDNWLIASAQSILGESLIDQSRFEEAEPLVLAGYEGMRGALAVPEIRPREALERIVKLYEQWDKPHQATEWRARLSQLGDG